MRPLGDHVLIRVTPPKEKTTGGILVPELAKKRLAWDDGEVLAVGPGKMLPNGRLSPMESRAGDRVLFARTAGFGGELVRRDETLLFLREADVVAVLEPGTVLG